MSIGSSALSEREEATFVKQIEKKRMITPYKIMIGLTIFCIVAMLSYKVYTLADSGATASKIINSQNKYIQNAESSSGQDSGSQTGSQSSKSSQNSGKSMGVSQTVGKDVIAPNSGNGGDGDDNSEEDNDGEKRERIMKSNKITDGSSTEGDSEEQSGEDSEEVENQGMVWPNNGANSMPLVGSTRP